MTTHSQTGNFQTVFGSLQDYTKGELQIIDDDPKNYCFSNVFDVASKSKAYEKVVVAINLGYVLEAVRAEGTSPWYAASHDEFAIVMDGDVEVELLKLDAPDSIAPASKRGSVLAGERPAGRKMGTVRARRGHQVLLPKGAAYRFKANTLSVILMQTVEGELSVKKWRDICYT